MSPIVRAMLLASFGGKAALLADVVGVFLADTPIMLERLRTAARAGDADEVAASAHSPSAGCRPPERARIRRGGETPGRTMWIGPPLGAHVQEVLASFGFDATAVEALRAERVVGRSG